MKSVWLTAAACAAFSFIVSAQTLVLTTETASVFGADVADTAGPNTVLARNFSAGSFLSPYLRAENLEVMIGDGNQSGLYDDMPTAIDAVAVTPQGMVTNDVTGLLFSTTTSAVFADGQMVIDGDVFAIKPNGSVEIVFAESFFMSITGTTTIDVDAFHIDPDGSILFSFDADEVTSLASLGIQNGNVTIDETVVFRWVPGDQEATIAFTKNQILGIVNQAIGQNLTTVVDLIGICEDPSHPGDYLFSFGSANNFVEGKVFSTFAGGVLGQMGGVTLDSPTLGFSQTENLNGLAILPTSPTRMDLVHPGAISSAAGSTATFRVRHCTPNHVIRLVAAASLFPAPATNFVGALAPNGWVFLDFTDPFLNITMNHPAFGAFSGANGEVSFTFSTAGLAPNTSVTLQAFDVTNLSMSQPIAVEN